MRRERGALGRRRAEPGRGTSPRGSASAAARASRALGRPPAPGLGWLTQHPVIGPWGWTPRLQSNPMTTDEQAGKDALWELHEAGKGVKERRAELASLTHRCGAFSSAVTKKLGQLGREEGHPHPPSSLNLVSLTSQGQKTHVFPGSS